MVTTYSCNGNFAIPEQLRAGARRAPEGSLPRAEAEPGGGVMASPRGHERAVGTSERVYRVLLRAYPRELRDEYGGEMAPLTPLVVGEALRGVRDHSFSYYDAQIWAAAHLGQVPTIRAKTSTQKQ